MFGRKKKKKNVRNGKINSMKVNGTDTRCLNLRIFYDENGVGKLEIHTREPEPAFHFDRCEFEVNTLDNKRLMISGAFDNASQEGRLYRYLFVIQKINEYYA